MDVVYVRTTTDEEQKGEGGGGGGGNCKCSRQKQIFLSYRTTCIREVKLPFISLPERIRPFLRMRVCGAVMLD